MEFQLVSLYMLLYLTSALSFVVVDLNHYSDKKVHQKETISICHTVHMKKCELKMVEEMMPGMREVCWKETK